MNSLQQQGPRFASVLTTKQQRSAESEPRGISNDSPQQKCQCMPNACSMPPISRFQSFFLYSMCTLYLETLHFRRCKSNAKTARNVFGKSRRSKPLCYRPVAILPLRAFRSINIAASQLSFRYFVIVSHFAWQPKRTNHRQHFTVRRAPRPPFS